jgi:DinB family
MTITELFKAQLDREGPITRRVLENAPEGRPDWKPHPKSMPLGYLSTLVAGMPGWVAMAIKQDELDLMPKGVKPDAPVFSTRRELLRAVDEAIAKSREALASTNDDYLMTPWRLLLAGKVVMEAPRHAVIEDTFTHLAHHRGQLTVYMRLNEAKVPSVYGPSADDQRF